MKADWKDETLGGLFEIGSSKRVLQKQWKQEGVPFYRAREIVKLAKDGSVENDLFISEDHFTELKDKHGVPSPGDLMVSAVGTLGACYVVQPNDRFYFKDASVLRFHPKLDVCSRFYQYAFQWDGLLDTVKKSDGATVGTLTISRAKDIPVPLPPLEEQKRIVAILDEAFEGLARARAHAKANLQNAHDLFESALFDLYEVKLADSGRSPLSEVCDLISGQHIEAKDYNNEGIGIGYLTGPSDFGNVNPVVTKWTEKPKRTAFCGDILITVKGSGVGSVNIMNADELAISRQLMAIRSKGVPMEYLFGFIRMQQRYFQELSNGAAIPGISRNDVLNLKIPIPSEPLQSKYVTYLDDIEKGADLAKNNYEAKIQDLDELRQSLLQKAFAGELT